ncbi:MAG: ribonuclease P protein component [Nitrospirota bacterium]
MNSKRILHPINKNGDFKKVFEQGSKFSSKYLVIYARPNRLTYSRLGLSVSKKIGNAVTRNRIKRRLREAIRKQLMDKPVRYDFVVVARRSSVEAEFSDLKNNIFKFFSGLADENNFNSSSEII